MRNDVSPQQVASVRAAIAVVRASLAALVEQEQQHRRDLADCAAFEGAAAQRARGFSPRNPASAALFAQDGATAELWRLYLANAPARRAHLEHERGMAMRELIDRLWGVMDYFEQKFNSPESLAMLGAEGAIDMAQGIISRRLPPHDEFLETASPVDKGWLERSYRMLLAGAIREPVQPTA